MAKTDTLTIRIDPQVKKSALKIFEKLGMTASEAITLYFTQVSAEKGLPFRPHIPNAETERVIRDALAGKDVHAANDFDDLVAQLEA